MKTPLNRPAVYYYITLFASACRCFIIYCSSYKILHCYIICCVFVTYQNILCLQIYRVLTYFPGSHLVYNSNLFLLYRNSFGSLLLCGAVFHCVSLYCIAKHCIALSREALHCIISRGIALYCEALHFIVRKLARGDFQVINQHRKPSRVFSPLTCLLTAWQVYTVTGGTKTSLWNSKYLIVAIELRPHT